MDFSNVNIGARIIEAITSGLYDGNLNCIREYVQNSIDAGASEIEILFLNGGSDLVIKDNGSGMDRKGLETALGIGISDKGEDDVGWRGIGFWSGVSAASKIVVITKTKGGEKLRLVINCEMIKRGYSGNSPVLEVLSSSTGEVEPLKLGKDESLTNDHYTEIRLESIPGPQRTIYREHDIISYLQKNVPAKFDASMFKLAYQIDDYLKEKGVKEIRTRIHFQSDEIRMEIFKPPFKNDIYFDKFTPKEFYVETKEGKKLAAVGWFVTSKKNRALAWPDGGVFFKKKHFTIGDENLVKRQTDGATYSQWQYGEIHIIDPGIKENAPRNLFETSEITDKLMTQVGDFLLQLQVMNRHVSARTASNQVTRIRKALDKGNLNDAKEEIEKAQGKFRSVVSFPTDPSLQPMKEVIDSTSCEQRDIVGAFQEELKEKKDEGRTDRQIAKSSMDAVLDGLHPVVRGEIAGKRTRKGLKDPAMQITDAIVGILKEKTGLTESELSDLTKVAFDYYSVERAPGSKGPLITIVGQFDLKGSDKDAQRLASRNRRFGLAISTFHDLLVNMDKHSKGKKQFEWFEKATEAERDIMMAEAIAAVDLMYRILDKAEKFGP
ncbi:MAG TPA: ATP-binding protein [Methanomassiliicoccales archaeon]